MPDEMTECWKLAERIGKEPDMQKVVELAKELDRMLRERAAKQTAGESRRTA